MTTIRVTSQLVIELGGEGTTSHCATSAGIFSTTVQESGKEDGSDTVTVVTPRRLHVYCHPSKFHRVSMCFCTMLFWRATLVETLR